MNCSHNVVGDGNLNLNMNMEGNLQVTFSRTCCSCSLLVVEIVDLGGPVPYRCSHFLDPAQIESGLGSNPKIITFVVLLNNLNPKSLYFL